MKRLIPVIGAHGSGKTTAIKKYINKSSKRFITVGEIARNCPFEIGSSSNKLAQKWIMNKQFEIEFLLSGISIPSILDRCLIDQYAYYIYWVGRSKIMEKKILRMLSFYERIFVFNPNSNFLIFDGFRPTNSKFQIEIHNIILTILRQFKIDALEIDAVHFHLDNFDNSISNIQTCIGELDQYTKLENPFIQLHN